MESTSIIERGGHTELKYYFSKDYNGANCRHRHRTKEAAEACARRRGRTPDYEAHVYGYYVKTEAWEGRMP